MDLKLIVDRVKWKGGGKELAKEGKDPDSHGLLEAFLVHGEFDGYMRKMRVHLGIGHWANSRVVPRVLMILSDGAKAVHISQLSAKGRTN